MYRINPSRIHTHFQRTGYSTESPHWTGRWSGPHWAIVCSSRTVSGNLGLHSWKVVDTWWRCSHLRMYKYYNWSSGLRWLARLNFTDGPPHALCSLGVGKPTAGSRRKSSPWSPASFWSLDCRFPLVQLYTSSLVWASGVQGSGGRSLRPPSPLPVDSIGNPEIKCNRGKTVLAMPVHPKAPIPSATARLPSLSSL